MQQPPTLSELSEYIQVRRGSEGSKMREPTYQEVMKYAEWLKNEEFIQKLSEHLGKRVVSYTTEGEMQSNDEGGGYFTCNTLDVNFMDGTRETYSYPNEGDYYTDDGEFNYERFRPVESFWEDIYCLISNYNIEWAYNVGPKPDAKPIDLRVNEQ